MDAIACTDERVCEAKRVCMEALDPTARALALKDEVGVKLADSKRPAWRRIPRPRRSCQGSSTRRRACSARGTRRWTTATRS